MHKQPFDKPGQWFRGNLHTHSTRSDGRLTPEALADVAWTILARARPDLFHFGV